MKVKSWIAAVAVVGVMGLGMGMSVPTVGQPPPSVSQQQELAEAEKLHQQVVQLYQQGKYSEAIPLAEQVLAIRKKILGDNHPDVAQSFNNLALLYKSQGRYAEAESLFIEALAIRKQHLGDNHRAVAASLNNLAALYQVQGRYAEAEPLLKKALAIHKEQLGDQHPATATSLNNLAALYEAQGRYAEAEPLHQQALAIRKQKLGNNHRAVANSLNNLAALYQAQGRYAEAEPLLQQALAIRKQQLGDNHPDVATSLNNLAFLYQAQGRYTEAEPLLIEALAIVKQRLGDNHPQIAQSLSNLAALYQDQGKYAEAEPLYRQALAIRKQQLGENHPDVATSLNNLAFLYRVQGRYTEAEPLYRQALAIRKQQLGDNHPYVATSLNNLAGLYGSQGSITRAIEVLDQGLMVQEYNLSQNLVAGSESQKQDYMATISGTTDATISLHLQSAPNNPTAANLALTTILQRKGRILDILTNSLQILRQRTNDPESQDLLTQLIVNRTQLANLTFQKPDEIKSPEAYRKQKADLEEKARQLEDQISRRSAEFQTLSQPITLEAIQKLIPPDTALVEFVQYQPFNPKALLNEEWGKPRYAAYILRFQGDPQAIDLGEAAAIEESLNYLRDNLRDKATPIEQLKVSARQLDAQLMQPVRQLLGDTKTLLLSPDAALNLIPFEALVDENNRYLVETYQLTYLTSGRDLLRLQLESPNQQPPVIMADPSYSKKGQVVIDSTRSVDLSQFTFDRLSGTKEEATQIQTLFPQALVLTDIQATENALKQVNQPIILHLATHGFFLEKAESKSVGDPLLRSGLVLAGVELAQSGGDDGVLTALETTILNLVGTQLVVLSACDTGVGDVSTGEGVYGLRRALVIAGSESQLISLWKVSDNATKDLMVTYYQRLQAGEGRTEALRQTQLEMLKSEHYQHPYYWASFIPSGDWTPMTFTTSR